MCLRYAFAVPAMDKLKERFGVEKSDMELKPRYNIAPTQAVPAVFNDSPASISEAIWGLPGWGQHPIFNARAESVDDKFRNDFLSRRCLMLADSFYEWKDRRPFRVFLNGNDVFAFAAIYEEKQQRTCCMLTTASNALVSQVHERMPVILPAGKETEWLTAGPEEAKKMLKPFPAEKMGMFEVSRKVNSARTDSPDMIEPKSAKGTLIEYMR